MRDECQKFKGRMSDLCNCTNGVTVEQANAFRATAFAGRLEPLDPGDASPSPRIPTVPYATVPYRPPRLIQNLTAYPCTFRGDKVRDDTSNLCGSRGEQTAIFECHCKDADGNPKHGECSLWRYCTHQTVQVCTACPDRQPPATIGAPFPAERGISPFRYNGGNLPEFITTAKMMDDVKILASKIPPETSRIIGVARSGVGVASMLSMMLHLPLTIVRQTSGDIVDAGNGWRLTGNTGGQGPPVVVDDTVLTGNSFKHVMPIVWGQYPGAISAALYVNPHTRQKPDLWVRDLPWPHLLEWNLFNSVMSPHIAVDFDGILCDDCHPADDDDGDRYRTFLMTAKPKYMIRKTRVPLIVTARLEKWRPETEDWLVRHGIAVDNLFMGPWKQNRERTLQAVSEFKAAHFRSFLQQKHRVKPPMFVESDAAQAERIARLSGGLVVCPAAGRCF